MDTLTRMRVLRRVVERGSFSAAAADLELSNSAVSKHIRQLEAYLGARLLNRTTRRLSLTEAGRAYYERCVRLLDDVDEAELAVRQLNVAPRGRLKINAPMSFGILHLAPALPEFSARYPEVEVDVVLNDRFVDLIEEGFDVALRIITDLPDSTLVGRRLASIRRVVCAAPAYLERHGVPTTPEDLKDHQCLIYSFTDDHWRFDGPAGAQVVKVAGKYRINNSIALREALLAGMGIALIPTFLVGPLIGAGALVSLLDEHYTVEPHGLYAVYPQNRYLLPKLRAFVNFMSERFGDLPPWDATTGETTRLI